MNDKIILFLFLLVISFSSMHTESIAQSNGGKISECQNVTQTNFKFKVVSTGKAIKEPYIVGMRIVLKDQHFNVEDLTHLIESIKNRYCNEDKIAITFFDDLKVARNPSVIVSQLVGEHIYPEIRGFYTLDRSKKIEKLSFSKIRGASIDEVTLSLLQK